MEAAFAPYSSADQPIPPYNKQQQMKNPSKRNHFNKNFSNSRSTENLAPLLNHNNIHGGFFFAPPPPHSLSISYPPYNNTSIPFYPNQILQRQISQQPPLLPIPISTQSSLPVTRTRSDLSCPPPTRKTNRNTNRDNSHSLTPKKSKQPIKKQGSKTALVNINPTKATTTVPLVPELKPNDLPKNVSSPAPPSLSSTFIITGNDVVHNSYSNTGAQDFERFTGSIFTLSPPPSSLPLPKFSIRRKALSCTAEAAGNVDTGATDNLRRILRL